jgi:hypothetical protein
MICRKGNQMTKLAGSEVLLATYAGWGVDGHGPGGMLALPAVVPTRLSDHVRRRLGGLVLSICLTRNDPDPNSK